MAPVLEDGVESDGNADTEPPADRRSADDCSTSIASSLSSASVLALGSPHGLLPLSAIFRSSTSSLAGFLGESARARAMALNGSAAALADDGDVVLRVVPDAVCAYPDCPAGLAPGSRFHCRRCSGWYCRTHAGHPGMAMRLVVGTGEPDAQRGVWSRVCLRCFRRRFYDDNGSVDPARRWAALPVRERTAELERLRAHAVEARALLVGQLMGRFTRMAALPRPGDRREQQRIVPWERDAAARSCRVCDADFSVGRLVLEGKHHCRLCGLVICEACSRSTPLASPDDAQPAAHVDGVREDAASAVRTCARCDAIVTLHRRRADPRVAKLRTLHAELAQVRAQIADGLLPQYHALLERLQLAYSGAARDDAEAARTTLVLLFRHADAVSRQIGALCDDPSVPLGRVCAAIRTGTSMFVRENIPDLHALPLLLRRCADAGADGPASGRDAASDTHPREKSHSPAECSPGTPASPAQSAALTSDGVSVYKQQRETLQRQLEDGMRSGADPDAVRALEESIADIDAAISGRAS